MKIYFAGSIRGGSEDRNVYHTLIKGLQEFGQALTEHVGDPELTDLGEDDLPDEEIFQRDVSSTTVALLNSAVIAVVGSDISGLVPDGVFATETRREQSRESNSPSIPSG